MRNDIVIAAAGRTAVGSFNGSFAATPAHQLGASVAKAVLERAKVDPAEVDDVILGQVLTGPGTEPGPSGVERRGPAQGDDRLGAQPGLRLGLPCRRARRATDCRRRCRDHRRGRFAVASQNKAEAARDSGKFKDEIVPFTVSTRKGDIVVGSDEYIRPGTTLEAVAKLRPAFATKGGAVTAGNASGINDGAAALVLLSATNAEKRGMVPLARIASWATAGVDPALMGTGPIPAARKALKKAGWSIDDLDLIEANEAFAAQACAVNKKLGWDPEKVNVNGDAIAIGHPIGASGARILVTLLHELIRHNGKKGLATLCIGGGMSIALTVER